jgi:lipopolysaccharide transport system ATP-binding protein
MPSDIAIDIQNVSKCYRRYNHPIDRLKELIIPNLSKGQKFWALDNISFQVNRGESLGILGQNGSGKSTLLQCITQTLSPTSGTIDVRGRISALLELGSGFNPDFTGRQNVIINGRILGFSNQEIQGKLDEILEFAEIDDFVDQPVHTYSSGMFVRLAFAAAVVWEPEILIVDEALAVGDIFFQQKCFARIKSLQENGTTILFVSHDTQTVLNLCRRAIVLNHGKMIYLGDTSAAVERYFESHYMSHGVESQKVEVPSANSTNSIMVENIRIKSESNAPTTLPFVTHFPEKNRFGISIGLIEGVCITDANGQSKSTFLSDEELIVSIKLAAHSEQLSPLNVGFHLKDRLGQVIIGTNLKKMSTSLTPHSPGIPFICQFRFRPQIASGEYSLDAAVAEYILEAKTIYDWINGAIAFTLAPSSTTQKQDGLCRPDMTVSVHDCDVLDLVSTGFQ